jgi:aminoglycoside 3-N-acetyltransferase
VREFPPVVTKSRLCADLTRLGVRAGDTLMLHASVKAVGRIVGGPDMVIEALLDVLGADGTLMMMVSSEDSTYEMSNRPPEWREAYLAEAPPFDPKRSRAYRKWSVLTEYLRTWPGAERSDHPDSSFAAVGAKAHWLMADQPLNYALGPGSPLDKLCQAGGKVLLLGVGFDSLTLIHLAENLAKVAEKPIYRFPAHVLTTTGPKWIEIEEYDSNLPIGHWSGESYFEIIAREYLATGRGAEAVVGVAQSYLFEADALGPFAVAWLERRLGEGAHSGAGDVSASSWERE